MHVLIIEDNPVYTEGYKRACPDVITTLAANDLTAARALFKKHLDEIGIIILDGCVPGDRLNTLPFIREIRPIFFGALIAASSLKSYVADMMGAGCDMGFDDKETLMHQLPQIVTDLTVVATQA